MPRPLPQLIKPAPALVFRDSQQRFKLVPLGLTGQFGQTLPGPERHPVTDLRDQTRQGRNAGQQYLAPDEPARGQLEQVTWPLIAEPRPGIKPPVEAKPPRRLSEILIGIYGADFGSVL